MLFALPVASAQTLIRQQINEWVYVQQIDNTIHVDIRFDLKFL